VQLTLDHVILRAADPAAVLDELVARTGAPVLTPVHAVGALKSGIVRASVDIEVLAIGATPPPRVQGYSASPSTRRSPRPTRPCAPRDS
jgi:hypothetical protein